MCLIIMYNTSSVLECKVGKSPNITQTHSKANTGQDELYWVRPLGSLQYDRRAINWLLDYCGVFFYSNTSVVPPQPLLWPPLNIMFIITFFFLISFSKWADDFCMIVLLKFCSVERLACRCWPWCHSQIFAFDISFNGKDKWHCRYCFCWRKNLLFS